MVTRCLTGRDGHSQHLEAQAEHGLRRRIDALQAQVDLEQFRVRVLLDALDERDRRLAELGHRIGQLGGCGATTESEAAW